VSNRDNRNFRGNNFPSSFFWVFDSQADIRFLKMCCKEGMKSEQTHDDLLSCRRKPKDVITTGTDVDPVLFLDSFFVLFNFYIVKINILFTIRTDSHGILIEN
jgi:hypothetical protein